VKRQQGGPEGLLLVDKPAGWTSHDVVAKVRRLAGQRRIGHTGTLDPAATGLLVLCLGRATRLVEFMEGHRKAYSGEVVLGVRTATDDAEGDVLERRPVPEIDERALRQLEAAFSGELDQVPPAYSAVSVGGTRAYAAARKGRALDLPSRRVTVYELSLRWAGAERIAIDVECSAGTYVRSLARDIGKSLGCGAHLAMLRRTRVGRFSVQDAPSLAGLEAAIRRAGGIEPFLLPADEALLHLRVALLSSPADSWGAGPKSTGGLEALRVYGARGEFRGIAGLGQGAGIRPWKVIEPVTAASEASPKTGAALPEPSTVERKQV
jgi:tRNA pseudouridine55 synthase